MGPLSLRFFAEFVLLFDIPLCSIVYIQAFEHPQSFIPGCLQNISKRQLLSLFLTKPGHKGLSVAPFCMLSSFYASNASQFNALNISQHLCAQLIVREEAACDPVCSNAVCSSVSPGGVEVCNLTIYKSTGWYCTVTNYAHWASTPNNTEKPQCLQQYPNSSAVGTTNHIALHQTATST